MPDLAAIEWQAGDPCRACGSTETSLDLNEPGRPAVCGGCGARDDDD